VCPCPTTQVALVPSPMLTVAPAMTSTTASSTTTTTSDHHQHQQKSAEPGLNGNDVVVLVSTVCFTLLTIVSIVAAVLKKKYSMSRYPPFVTPPMLAFEPQNNDFVDVAEVAGEEYYVLPNGPTNEPSLAYSDEEE